VRAAELLHLRGGGLILADETDLIDPFDACAAIPAGHEEAHRRAVVERQRHAVHVGGEKGAGAGELLEGEDPAGPGDGPPGGLRMIVETGDEHATGRGKSTEQSNHLAHRDPRPGAGAE
jgi:hypothetical protein